MEMKGRYKILCGVITSLALGCTKPYNPAIVASNNNYLVVEGNINTGTDSTTIQLSRTTNIASGITSLPDPNATVAIQDNQNGSYSLRSNGDGSYTSALLTLDPARMYRLSITTADGKVYVSDYVPAKAFPPIDSVGYKPQNTGVQIYVNTHDPNNATHYYRWDYNETWQFHSMYDSEYVTNGTKIVPREPSQQIYQCWSNDISNDIELASSAKLAQDVIYQAPLTFVPSTSEKISIRYSILVKQYAMTTDGYNYYSLLKQNTEQLGSIFDAQPSTLTGNIHCTSSPTLPVIGYVTAGTVAQKRIYIDYSTLPSNYITIYPYTCEQDTAYFADPRSHSTPLLNTVALWLIPLNSASVPTTAFTDNFGNIIGYFYSDHDCVDCSIRGTTVQPGFWVNGPYN
jgi:hypothetical protein